VIKERAKAFEIWEDTRIELGMTREELAKAANVDLRWLNNFINDGVFADQLPRIKRIERVLQLRLPDKYYECRRVPDLKSKE
jgi:transcriptional regulator with XRE-family HTH domain